MDGHRPAGAVTGRSEVWAGRLCAGRRVIVLGAAPPAVTDRAAAVTTVAVADATAYLRDTGRDDVDLIVAAEDLLDTVADADALTECLRDRAAAGVTVVLVAPREVAAGRLAEAERAIAELERTNARLARTVTARFEAEAALQARLEQATVELARAEAALARLRADEERQRRDAAGERERLAADLEALATELATSQADAAAAWGRYLTLRDRRAVRMALSAIRRLGR